MNKFPTQKIAQHTHTQFTPLHSLANLLSENTIDGTRKGLCNLLLGPIKEKQNDTLRCGEKHIQESHLQENTKIGQCHERQMEWERETS